MVLDIRELSFIDSFKKIRSAYLESLDKQEDIMVVVGTSENDRLDTIKDFIKNCLNCRPTMQESNGYYVLKIRQECVAVV